MKKTLPLLLGGLFCLWAGYMASISFMEAPLKFQAPFITLKLGLGIGRLVFQTLNKVEVVFALLSALLFWLARPTRTVWVLAAAVWAILLLQTAWLLPALDIRAVKMLAGESLPPSSLHWFYIAADGLKLLLLLAAAFVQFHVFANPKPNQP